MQGLVLRAVSGFFTVRVDAAEGGHTLTCKLRGKLKKERQKSELAVAGDRVEVERTSETEGMNCSRINGARNERGTMTRSST
jgi:ribosome biogenesis GTPase